ncbi:MAG: M20/M25/M40 family metallo-hydrolase [Halovenus sp.]
MTAFQDSDEESGEGCPFCFGEESTAALPEAVDEDTAFLTEFLDSHEADLAGLTQELIGIDSQNPPGTTRDIIEYIEQFANALGVQSELIVADDSRPNLLITLPGETETTLLYKGHVDTIPYDRDAWTYDPLGERDGDRIYGRGATDMKGAVAAMLHTVRAYAETGTVPPVTLQFALVSDEETTGAAGLPALLDRGRLTADACLVGETTCEAGAHSVTIADKGSIWLTLEATGTAAHGSRAPLGENAIDRLIAAVTAIQDRLVQVDLALADDVVPIVEESVSFYAPRMDEETAWRLFTAPTVNLGTLHGGGAIDRVPETAMAELDVRLTASVDTPSILARIEEVLDGYPSVEIADVSWSMGTYEPFDSPLVGATARIAETVVGEPVHRRSATGGGAKTLRDEGVPTVEFAFGSDTAHAADEYTTTGALRKNAEVFAKLPFGFAALTDQVDSTRD